MQIKHWWALACLVASIATYLLLEDRTNSNRIGLTLVSIVPFVVIYVIARLIEDDGKRR